LYLADRRPIEALANDAASQKARAVALSDGSQLVLSPGTTLELLENNGQRFAVLLERGSAEFHVRPGGPRRWIIEGGLATVEVVGTRFSVERQRGHMEVRVAEGVVLVHGELVPGRVQRLRAGAVLTLAEPASAAAEPEHAGGTAPRPVTKATAAPTAEPVSGRMRSPAAPELRARPSVVVAKTPQVAAVPSWRTFAQEHDYHQAWDALGPDGLKKQLTLPLSLDDLLTLSDVARLSGHPADALPLLQQAIVHFPADKRVGLLAYTRGRIYFDDLHQPGGAAQAFAQALALGLPQALREDAYSLLVEARMHAGDRSGARAAAREYAARFPSGRFAERIQRLVQEP
jgi:transmembrane sensor